ncbi:TPA: hypothetical protein I8438_002269 [Serratia marcescens]|uniref:Uncharacterized protein n=1 Tax=Serratia marcescens TaxID=615 RepID=A0AB33G226_SERMA|nr:MULTISPECIES: hypothetical protein [Serratia]AKL43790.1 hypothetical protein AB188_26155 [Serratia marcescens]AWL71160.1 hypothetical protein DKC05_27685 [Serratia marcescens]UBI64115.1 hypothetical protein GF111_25470 [Serratia sp. HRI]HAT2210445.1 hypothetical protein [Serratia marcescens]HAT2221669.1 hypothetical protein [Serratia marcescens]
MARKETFITIDAAGRDQGKVFYIKEMSASQAEWWALRALMAMGRGGVEIPDNLRSMGIAAMAVEGLKAISKIHPDEAKPLLDELMTCVQAVPNPADKTVVRPLIEADIDEVATRLNLSAEVFKLHVDFFATAGR